jgi:hypothetical protein
VGGSGWGVRIAGGLAWGAETWYTGTHEA